MDDLIKARVQGAAIERSLIVSVLKQYRAEVTAGIPPHVAMASGDIVDGAIEKVTSMSESGTRSN